MEIATLSTSGQSPEHRVPVETVTLALSDARLPVPKVVDRAVALSIARGSDKTARLRLERLARVVMAASPTLINPNDPAAAPLAAWSTDWTQMTPLAAEALDRTIRERWSSVSTRNAMRDAVRAVFRAARSSGLLTYDKAEPLLSALRPEKPIVDDEKQSRGHIPTSRFREVAHELAQDRSLTARRDAALIALLLGGGLRRAEAVGLDLSDLDEHQEAAIVTGKGNVVREVPFSPGARQAIREWLEVRGAEPGPLITPITRTKPREPITSRRLSTSTVAQIIARRFGKDVAPHDLRRTFTGDLLDSGVDLATVSKLLGHRNPMTTMGYDRRSSATRRAAVGGLLYAHETPSSDAYS